MRAPLLMIAVCAVVSAQPAPRIPEGWKVHKDLDYVPFAAARQKLDLYLPPSPVAKPLVIWIHGGAWRAGNKDNPPPLRLLTDHRYAVASIAYRLSSQAKFPAQIEDCKAAIRWLRAHAAEYGLDPDRFAVWGSSAGGHLAALVGTAGDRFDIGQHNAVSSRVQAVIDYFGPTDFLAMDAHALPTAPFKHNAPDSPESALVGGPILENALAVSRANPATYATKDDPPFLIVHGDQDPLVPLHQSEILREALDKAGVRARLYVVKGAGHGQGFDKDPAIVPMVKEFIETAFSRK